MFAASSTEPMRHVLSTDRCLAAATVLTFHLSTAATNL